MKWLSENYQWLFDGIGVVVFSFLVGYALSFWRRRKERKLAWPKEKGAFVAVSSEAIPPFPHTLAGFRPAGEDKDFWNKPFRVKGSIRLFSGDDWLGIPDFPNTMNGCSAGRFMIRWRSARHNVRVRSSVRHSNRSDAHEKAGAFGYMSGTNCEQPMFKFGGAGHELVDVYYELKFWQAAP